jgi:hypothetical protein
MKVEISMDAAKLLRELLPKNPVRARKLTLDQRQTLEAFLFQLGWSEEIERKRLVAEKAAGEECE